MGADIKKLINQEIAKVFAMYFGQECYMLTVHNEYKPFRVDGAVLQLIGEIKYFIILTPLDKITDEHAIEVGRINGVPTYSFLLVGKSMTHWLAEKGTNRDVRFEIYQQLIIWGYAVPLWFEIDHWANGKTAIELGLAIDASTQKQ
jgi:hypothetical protein